MTQTASYDGACFCGSVRIRVRGAPAGQGYCHCESCRAWSVSPVNAFTLWTPDSVLVLQGSDLIAGYAKTNRSLRKYCRKCGGHLFTEHPRLGLIDVYAATIPSFPFAAAVHVNYQETVLRMKDGLPKFRDYPAPMGGSGESIAE